MEILRAVEVVFFNILKIKVDEKNTLNIDYFSYELHLEKQDCETKRQLTLGGRLIR